FSFAPLAFRYSRCPSRKFMAFPDLLLFRFLAFISLSRFWPAFSLLARFLAMSATRIGLLRV
ncbi:MAG: hypothetical protein O3A73_09935, partial [Proteobacteria bacterium]|nr:hypothetical protein [Pseudomonadota bacterium]